MTLAMIGSAPHLVPLLAGHVILAATGSGGATFGPLPKPPFDQILALFLQTLIFLANFVGGLIIGVAVVRTLIIYLVDLARRRGAEVPKEVIRISLGRSLALALEFQLAADILATALNPSKTDIFVLAAIIGLRTILNFFLGRELATETKREAAQAIARGKGSSSKSEAAG